MKERLRRPRRGRTYMSAARVSPARGRRAGRIREGAPALMERLDSSRRRDSASAGTGLIGTRTFNLVAKVPRRILGPFVLILIVVGSFVYANYTAHVVMVLILGALAYYFEKINIPVVPIVLAFIMGRSSRLT